MEGLDYTGWFSGNLVGKLSWPSWLTEFEANKRNRGVGAGFSSASSCRKDIAKVASNP
jgi:hypothetical protein